MPYEWTQVQTAPEEDSGAVLYQLVLRPNRSLPRRGFVWFIGVTASLMVLPLSAVLGTSALWGLLPFSLLAIWGLWVALRQSYRSGETWEELSLSRTRLELRRHDPGLSDRVWQVNSYWVRAAIRKGPVEHYLTLTDGQREVELGAFLSPEERQELLVELQRLLSLISKGAV